MIEKMKALPGKWSVGFDGKQVAVGYRNSYDLFNTFAEAEAFVDKLLEENQNVHQLKA